MTETHLQTIERELGVRLPEDYKALHREFDDDYGWLFDSPEEVIEETRFPMEAGDYDRANWRSSYLAIGDSGSGDLLLIDREQEPSPVYVLSHEDHSITVEWASLNAFVLDCQNYRREAERRRQEDVEGSQVRGRNRRVFLCALFALIGLPLLELPLLIFGPGMGIPHWVSSLFGLTAFVFLARLMAWAIRGGIHY